MRKILAAWLALFILTPASAQAHSVTSGKSAWVNGALHPLLTPTHLLILVPIGLAMGAKKLLGLNRFFVLFIPATAAGLAFTFAESEWQLPILAVAVIAIATGANLALALPTNRPFHLVTGVIAGFCVGLDSAPDPTISTSSKLVTLLATWIVIVALTADLAFYSSTLPDKKWIKIGFRVLGSWITAISIMLFAFALRPVH